MTPRALVTSALCVGASFAWALGCTPAPVTEVVVVVHTTFEVPAALDGLRITAARAGSAAQSSSGPWQDGNEPRTLGLVHDGGALGPVDVSVVGFLGPTDVVQRDASFFFVQGEIRRLDLWLVPECAIDLRACRGTDTCDPGPSCRSATAAPGELLPWSTTPPDAMVATPDAAASDAGPLLDAPGLDAPISRPDAGCCPASARGVLEFSCASGTCEIVACEPPLAHCDMSIENGCETSLDARANCGACDHRCTGGTSCVAVGDSYDCR